MESCSRKKLSTSTLKEKMSDFAILRAFQMAQDWVVWKESNLAKHRASDPIGQLE